MPITLEQCSRIRYNSTIDMSCFDCGNPDLNDFIQNDALNYAKSLLATTFVYFFKETPVAFISYLNDKITADENTRANAISRPIANSKRNRNLGYPAVKIGRLGVSTAMSSQGIGSQILDFTKIWFLDYNKTGCRFITLDAYNRPAVVNFYQRNGFKFLEKHNPTTVEQRTVLMYYDLIQLQ